VDKNIMGDVQMSEKLKAEKWQRFRFLPFIPLGEKDK